MEEYTPFMKQKPSCRPLSRKLPLSCLCLLLLLLFLITALVIAAGILVHFLTNYGEHIGKPISLQDIFNNSFHKRNFSGRFTSGDQILSLSDDGLELFNIAANTTQLLINISVWESLQAERWYVSPSLSYLLLAHSTHKLYRYSYTADFSLLELSSGHNYSIQGSQWRVAMWTHSDQLVLANETGMYFINDVTFPNASNISLLWSSAMGELVGYPDWVYEEEILSSSSCVWASEVTKPVLAFLIFNSTGVPEATITEYGSGTGAYPSYRRIPYPKAGDQESSVQLWLLHTADNSSCQIIIPAEYHYVQSVQWSNATSLAVRFLDREQTQISLVLYNTTCHLLAYMHNYTTEGWVESTVLSSHFISGAGAVSLLPKNGYTQLVLISSDSSVTQLTFDQEVRSLLAVYESDLAFYTTANYSYETHLYAVSLTDSSHITCVSCLLREQLRDTEVANRECSVVSAVFSIKARYFILTCHGPDTPFTILMDSSLRLIKVLESNSALQNVLASVALPAIQPFQFNTVSHTFYGTLMAPVDYSQSNTYPVLLYVYGGPNSNFASLSHPLAPFSGFIAHLVSSLGFVVITVEGRGTCCRGQEYRFLVKNRLGVLEAEDQSRLSQYLLSQNWVNSVSIMGSSYGGYLSGMTSSEDSSLAAAVVISPVTDWRYYDSVYTQRYMGTPETNPKGYKNSSLVLRSRGIPGSNLLLIHGAADDNVHYQNSAELSLALKKDGQQFRMHTYFDENHHLGREGTREHLYKLIEAFLVENLSKCK